MPSAITRARAWALRTFAGRKQSDAHWEESAPVRTGPPVRFGVADLALVVTPIGIRAVGVNPPSNVFEVKLEAPTGGPAWSSRYGLGSVTDARAAALAGLEELWEIWTDQPTWERRLTEGMNPEEVEAILDSPAMRTDIKAARRLGPLLEAARDGAGGWILEEVAPGP